VTKGVGRAANPHGDHIVIEVGVRDGKIVTVGANDILAGAARWVGEVRHEVTFKTGVQARAHGETFAGCEVARRAALVLYKVFIGRTIDESLAISAGDVIAKMDGAPPDNEPCVATVVAAVRNALVDVQVTSLAEAIVEVRRLREAG